MGLVPEYWRVALGRVVGQGAQDQGFRQWRGRAAGQGGLHVGQHHHQVAVGLGARGHAHQPGHEQEAAQALVERNGRVGRDVAVALGVGAVAVGRDVDALVVGAAAQRHAAHKAAHPNGIELHGLGPEAVHLVMAGRQGQGNIERRGGVVGVGAAGEGESGLQGSGSIGCELRVKERHAERSRSILRAGSSPNRLDY